MLLGGLHAATFDSQLLSRDAGMGGAAAEKLRGLGFAQVDVEDALAISVAQKGRPDLEMALDWLCLNVQEEELPPAFRAGVALEHCCLSKHFPSAERPAFGTLLAGGAYLQRSRMVSQVILPCGGPSPTADCP